MTTAYDTKSKFIDVKGTKFAYREYGERRPGEVPLVLLHRFRATMDDWDPLFIDSLSGSRHVIAFDNRGVGETAGETPQTLEQAADDSAAFIRALELTQVDVLGWSMGGMQAPILATRHSALIRKMVLAGTCPPGSPESAPSPEHWMAVAGKPAYKDEDILYIFFTKSAQSLKAGRESLARMNRPGAAGSSVKSTAATMQAQIPAIGRYWSDADGWFKRLKDVKQAALVANGDKDVAFPITDSVILHRELPNSHLAVYQDANHGFLFQVPEQFAADVLRFLEA
jgi:pimeloyl-ACP methyl ester carboxylesterase